MRVRKAEEVLCVSWERVKTSVRRMPQADSRYINVKRVAGPSVPFLPILDSGHDHAAERALQSAILVRDTELRIPDDLPQMVIRILEVPGVSSPECFARRLDDSCARARGLVHDVIDVLLAPDVMRECELGRTARSYGNAGRVRDILAFPESQLEP